LDIGVSRGWVKAKHASTVSHALNRRQRSDRSLAAQPSLMRLLIADDHVGQEREGGDLEARLTRGAVGGSSSGAALPALVS
jgi:hypothetical protein